MSCGEKKTTVNIEISIKAIGPATLARILAEILLHNNLNYNKNVRTYILITRYLSCGWHLS